MATSTDATESTDAAEPTHPFAVAGGDPALHAKCLTLVDKALTSCPKIKFMRQALTALGVKEDAELIKCIQCPDGVAAAGGYVPSSKEVLLCQQWVVEAPGEVENTIVHEMVHAYDDARAFFDWNDLTQHACSEIRAANLSGDCTFSREFDRGNIGPRNFAAAGQHCVRRRAQLSVAMHPGCKDEETARLAVERAWRVCYHDRAPFDDFAASKNDL